MFTPMNSTPGTKLKVIETLLLGANLVTSKSGIKGIKFVKNDNLFIYSNINKMYQYIYYLIRKRTEDKANRMSQSNNFYFKKSIIKTI